MKLCRKVWSCGGRKVRLGEKKKKCFVVFDGRRWHLPDNADIIEGFVWCQAVSYYDPNDKDDLGKNYISIGGIEIPDPRKLYAV